MLALGPPGASDVGQRSARIGRLWEPTMSRNTQRRKAMRYAISLLACSSAALAGPTLSATSYGTVRFGERVEIVEKRLHERVPAPIDAEEAHCRLFEFKAYPRMIFMIEDGVITRAETSSPVPTSFGITVGSPMKAIRRKFPGVKIEPHTYDSNGHYLMLKTANQKAAMVMEESGGRITGIRGGLIPSVTYVEGCL